MFSVCTLIAKIENTDFRVFVDKARWRKSEKKISQGIPIMSQEKFGVDQYSAKVQHLLGWVSLLTLFVHVYQNFKAICFADVAGEALTPMLTPIL